MRFFTALLDDKQKLMIKHQNKDNLFCHSGAVRGTSFLSSFQEEILQFTPTDKEKHHTKTDRNFHILLNFLPHYFSVNLPIE